MTSTYLPLSSSTALCVRSHDLVTYDLLYQESLTDNLVLPYTWPHNGEVMQDGKNADVRRLLISVIIKHEQHNPKYIRSHTLMGQTSPALWLDIRI